MSDIFYVVVFFSLVGKVKFILVLLLVLVPILFILSRSIPLSPLSLLMISLLIEIRVSLKKIRTLLHVIEKGRKSKERSHELWKFFLKFIKLSSHIRLKVTQSSRSLMIVSTMFLWKIVSSIDRYPFLFLKSLVSVINSFCTDQIMGILRIRFATLRYTLWLKICLCFILRLGLIVWLDLAALVIWFLSPIPPSHFALPLFIKL